MSGVDRDRCEVSRCGSSEYAAAVLSATRTGRERFLLGDGLRCECSGSLSHRVAAVFLSVEGYEL